MHTGVRYVVLIFLILPLAACAARITITQPDGSVVKMTEALYAHQLSTQAFTQRSTAETACFAAAGALAQHQPSSNDLSGPLMLATCMQGGAGQQVQAPQYVAPPSFLDRVVQLAPIAIGVGQVIAADRASQRQSVLQRDLAQIAATERAQTLGAFAGVSQSGYNALTSTAGAGYSALSSTAAAGYVANAATATAGFSALQAQGTEAIQAAAQATGAWAATVASLPPSYQLGDGSMIVTGDGNTSQTGAGLIDQSSTGRDRDVSRECTMSLIATVTGSAEGSATGGSGTTGPGGGYVAPIGFAAYPSPTGTNDCGG